MTEIENRARAIVIDKLDIEAKDYNLEADFRDDLGADSLEIVELIMEFEKEFNISIPDDQAEKIKTVKQVIDYLETNK